LTENIRRNFNEKIAYVPSVYTYDRQRIISNDTFFREQFGLPEKSFVFTCQNTYQKIMPEVFDIWMDILKEVPESVLWLADQYQLGKDNLIKQINPSKESGNQQPYMQNRVFDINGINPALTTLWNGANLINTSRIRRLTPIECERLQTVADNYTNHVSDSQRYKMLGNGWTVDVIAHIFKYITI
jgi:site-specific DNA-cytosine methylase